MASEDEYQQRQFWEDGFVDFIIPSRRFYYCGTVTKEDGKKYRRYKLKGVEKQSKQ